MAETAADTAGISARKRPGPALLVGLALALLAAGGGFYASWSGLVGAGADTPAARQAPGELPDIAFVALDPIVINLGPGSQARHLRFSAELEVQAAYKADVERLRPRVADLLNSYLRAVDPAMLEEPAALIRLRSQLIRRIQIVTGEGRVRDLLITEFVLN